MARGEAVLGMEGGWFFHASKPVFRDVSFLLDGARTGLVGDNGIGKSTLLKCLTGEHELNRGKVIRSRNLRTGYLSQEVDGALLPRSIRDVLGLSLARVNCGDEDWRIDVLFDEIGFAPERGEEPFGNLSGGWQRLMLIAGAARLEEPDILILDEPTNHLDFSHIARLERWLIEDFRLPLLVVSHDRAFLDRVTNRTLFLRSDGTHLIKAPFAQAREELLQRDAAAARQRALEEKEIKRLERVVARYKLWGSWGGDFASRQRAAQTRIDRLRTHQTAINATRERRLELADGELDARAVLRLHDLEVKTPDGARTLIRIPRFTLAAGDRVALLGPNGAGKSTLLNLLGRTFDPKARHYDGTGPIRFNPACRLAYFDQAMTALPLQKSLLEYLSDDQGVSEREAMRALAQAGFPHARIGEPIMVLSYGERSRLMFLKMKLAAPNLYLLDEPTSHLDIEGQEALETQLEETETACIFVSHDRHFTRVAANRFIEIRRGTLREIDDAEAFFEGGE